MATSDEAMLGMTGSRRVIAAAARTITSHTGPDGMLPPLLLVLTAVTGVVDAASYLKLGHVFVANMTGNVVFLGFALVGAIAAMFAGAAVGGLLALHGTVMAPLVLAAALLLFAGLVSLRYSSRAAPQAPLPS